METLTRERDEARAELRRLTDMAGDWIETDPSLRSSACIEVALDHAKVLDAEVQRLREPAHDPATCRVCQEHRRREADAVRRKGDQR
ncbi:MAG: hypothetical protein MUF10_20700 [Thermoanaerobaculaceae bacterium]|nr:hypothetical protein [Thermoanaerobaculaceae bacterium]